MTKIGCLTFHASYNYGSSLQTYALKTCIEHLFDDVEYTIINLRTDKQKELYSSLYSKHSLKNLYVRLFCPFKKKEIAQKARLFEEFFLRFNMSKELKTKDEVALECQKYDFIICGSDQIWNLRAKDFDWSYFLDFGCDGKKISYACSMGSGVQVLSDDEQKAIKKALNDFACLSCRDENTHSLLKELGFESTKCLDPTLLLSKQDWESLINERPINRISEPYILFYDLKRNKENWRLAKRISKQLKMPIIITSIPYPRVASCSMGFKKKFGVGPIDFVNYIANASLVVTSSFHGCVLSTILNKPFFVINSGSDERIKDFIAATKLENRMVDSNNYLEKISYWNSVNFDCALEKIKTMRESSIAYLTEALNG